MSFLTNIRFIPNSVLTSGIITHFYGQKNPEVVQSWLVRQLPESQIYETSHLALELETSYLSLIPEWNYLVELQEVLIF